MLLLSLKLAHVLSVVLFFGNIITGLFWKAHADHTRVASIQAHALQGIIRSDAIFTIPSVLVVVASGVSLALIGGHPLLQTPWIAWSIGAFTLSGILFVGGVSPLQRRLLRLAQTASEQGTWPSQAYRTASLLWEVVGALAIVLPLAALGLMVFKPV